MSRIKHQPRLRNVESFLEPDCSCLSWWAHGKRLHAKERSICFVLFAMFPHRSLRLGVTMTAKVEYFGATLFLVSAMALCITVNAAATSAVMITSTDSPQVNEVPAYQKDGKVTAIVVDDPPPPPPGVCIWYNSTDQVAVDEQSSCYSCIQQCDVEPECKAAVYVSYRAARVHLDSAACQEPEAVDHPSALLRSVSGGQPVSSRKAAPMLPIMPSLHPMTLTATMDSNLDGGRRELTAVTQSSSPQRSSPQAPLQPPPTSPYHLLSNRTTSSTTQPLASSGMSPLPSPASGFDFASTTSGGPSTQKPSPSLPGCIATGGDRTCAVTKTGRLGCWGSNNYNQSTVPANFSSNIAFVSTGFHHTCAVTTTGGLGCWGRNDYGQSTVPANFSSNIASVSAGLGLTCAVTTTGKLGCWGNDQFEDYSTVPFEFGFNIASVSVGVYHVCVVTTTGRLGCWGREFNDDVQITVPANFSSDIASVSAGRDHTCAVTTTGRLGCWGNNDWHGVDVPSEFSSNIASVSTSLVLTSSMGPGSDGAIVSFPSGHTCAVTTTGRLGCWGDNSNGRLALAAFSAGFQVDTVAVATGSAHTCALRQNGVLRCAGWKDYGQTNVPQRYRTLIDTSGLNSPEQPPVVTFCKGCIAASGFHTCAVTTTGRLGCWGRNDDGQSTVPANFSSNIAFVSASDAHTCAVTTTGRLGCWGAGQSTLPANFSSNIASVSAGLGHTCAVTKTGKLGCWGYNTYGQTSVPAAFSVSIASVSAGDYHTCAVTTTGALGCWGWNDDNQSTVPVNFSSSIASVSSGWGHTCVVTTTGKLGCWGYNESGQITVPADFNSNIASVSASTYHTCAVTTSREVGCWGKPSLPSSPQFLSGVLAVATGRGNDCVVRMDGALRCVNGYIDPEFDFGQSTVPSTMRNLLHNRALLPQDNIKFGYCPAFCNVAPSKCDNSGICGEDEKDDGACINGYYLTKEGTCGSCDERYPNCFACNDSKCGLCVSGFYRNTTKSCAACSDPNCQVCPNDVCETCLPYYAKDSDGACVPKDFDCAEGEYPFHCVGKKCSEPGFYTSAANRGCISRFNCDLLYTDCLFNVGVSCKDCCIRVTTDTGKRWYLMRFSDDLLVQCDPPPKFSRQCKWSPWNVDTRCGWNRRCQC